MSALLEANSEYKAVKLMRSIGTNRAKTRLSMSLVSVTARHS